MEGKYTGTRYVHSDAEIEARVWYEATESMMYEQEEKRYTGKLEKKYFVKINNFQINLYKTLPNFEKYDTINNINRLRIFSDFYLPIELGVCEYQEIEVIKRKYTKEELRKVLINKLESQLSAEINEEKKVLNKQINEREINGGLEIQLIYEVMENIGIKQRNENVME